jgi:hypothetical protein
VLSRQLGALPADQSADLLGALPALEALADQLHASLRTPRSPIIESASIASTQQERSGRSRRADIGVAR